MFSYERFFLPAFVLSFRGRLHRSRRHLQRIRGRLHDDDDNRCCTLVHLQFYSFRVIFSVFSSYEIIVSNYSTLVAKTREATVPTATWGRLDTAIMIMWRQSVSKDENLDPLVELLFLASYQNVSIWYVSFHVIFILSYPSLFLSLVA